MKIHDLVGLSKPLTRLIEVVSKGVGAVSSPYLIRKTAEARAHEIKVITDALKDVGKQNQLPVVYDGGVIEIWQKPEDGTLTLDSKPIDQRTVDRLDYQERKRQDNLEKITSAAGTALLPETTVPNQHPDEDWIARFFNCAQDISSQEMQELWGRILAGEIKKPGSYSLRTLDFVKNITKAEAEIFEKLGRLALQQGNTAFVATHDKQWLKKERNVHPMHQFLLGELGIMYPTDLALLAFEEAYAPEVAFVSGEHLLLISRGEIKSGVHLPIWKFTGIGRELLPLVPKPLDDQYLESVGKFFLQRKGLAAIAKTGEQLSDGQFTYQLVRKIQLEEQLKPETGKQSLPP